MDGWVDGKKSFSSLSSYPSPIIDKTQLKFTFYIIASLATSINNDLTLLSTPITLWSRLQNLVLDYILSCTCS